MDIDPTQRALVVDAVERSIRHVFEVSVPSTDGEWRADAERIADAVLSVLAGPD